MCPSNSRFNSTYLARSDAIISGYFSLKAFILQYCNNLLFSKFCRSASFASIGCSVFYAVRLVVSCCIPSQIRKHIVLWVSIIMATFISGLRITEKRAKDNSPYAPKFVFIFLPEKDGRTAIFFGYGRLLNLSGFYRSYTTKIGNFIKMFKSRYRPPDFFHDIPRNIGYGYYST